ncbi:MAG: MauE/DoxX family redox-associated membrane protein [Candidatus Udaeobacter sp.]
MNKTPNAQLPTSNAEPSEHSTLGVGRSALDVRRFLWRIVDFVLAGIFIFAGLTKILDLDHLIADLQHLRVTNAFADLAQLSLASPAEFASDIDNFKILPWPVSVALAFYLPWLEIFCALGLVFRFLYRGALSILSASIVVFTLGIVAAKVRGLDITCGCFGHASQHWSFPAHLLTNLAILAGLLLLSFKAMSRNRLQMPSNSR